MTIAVDLGRKATKQTNKYLEVANSILVRSHTFVGIDHKIISTAILLLSAARRVVVSYKREYVHEVLGICLVKLVR